ncbi:MAG TPA: Stp1/IreP family PP2C-type Ser/Thr phosphatase [Gaiellaceae bacterium]|jgi:protein phosphatase
MRIAQSHGGTDPGRKRRRNEDAFVCLPPLFAIADGMGGAQAGEVASGLAATTLKESGADGGGEGRVVELIQEANRRVHERATNDATAAGMGTTMTVALVAADGRVAMGHVGDSRAYLFRSNRLEQITDDHSLVAELVRRGELSPAEAEVHPQRSVITRALGTDPNVDVDAFSIESQPGDIFLLCSDGLSSMVDGRAIEEIIAQHRDDLVAATKALIQAANRGGGEDNITAVLFELAEGGPEAAREPDEQTREPAVELDEEDTLHPEDGIAPPPLAVDTMIVPAADIEAALAEHAGPEAARAGLGRRMLALVVIAALVAIIVALVWWGLAR